MALAQPCQQDRCMGEQSDAIRDMEAVVGLDGACLVARTRTNVRQHNGRKVTSSAGHFLHCVALR